MLDYYGMGKRRWMRKDKYRNVQNGFAVTVELNNTIYLIYNNTIRAVCMRACVCVCVLLPEGPYGGEPLCGLREVTEQGQLGGVVQVLQVSGWRRRGRC